MVDTIDEMYSSQQILIPPNLPPILKKYAKSAIRTQPRDLLQWSYYYFKAMANGLPPPVKERIEYPLPVTPTGLTPGFLKILFTQIGGNVKTVPKEIIEEKWQSICLELDKVEMLFKIGSFPQEVDWMKFLAIAAGSIENNLSGTMSLLCELLTEEPEGGSSMIPLDEFLILYRYLARLECGPINPYHVESDILVIDKKSEQKDIKYSDTKDLKFEESWDTLIQGVGKRESIHTASTDDPMVGESNKTLMILPKKEDMKLPLVSPRLSNVNVKSETGFEVWDKDQQLHNNVQEKTERGEPVKEEEVKEEHSTTEDNLNKIRDALNVEMDKHEDTDNAEYTEKEATSDDISFDDMGDAEIVADVKSSSEEFASKQDGEATIADEASTSAVDIKMNVEYILEADASMILIPTPMDSNESICSAQRSVKHVTDSENEPSVGQKLTKTASLKDLKIEIKRVRREGTPPIYVTGDIFWVHLPGIGAAVPQHVIDEVEVYARQCAVRQCGMVMPRNFRHFLCPTLDGLSEDVHLLKEPECFVCCIDTVDQESHKSEKMVDVIDQVYCSQQILIPPNLPSILKKYAKSAIRTQPRDLLQWSYYYFKAMADSLPPPVKERIEYPLPETVTGLTPGFLKVLYYQIGNVKTVPKEIIEDKWQSICLESDKVEMLFKIGSFPQEVDWMKFLAIAAGSIENNLSGTMSLLCELLTEEPEGGSSMITLDVFLILYKYLARLECGPVNPYHVESDISEIDEKAEQKDIKYSDTKDLKSEESWDTLIQGVGERESPHTSETDDAADGNLKISPHLLPMEVEMVHPSVGSPKLSDEIVKSEIGLEVWDKDQLHKNIQEKTEVGEPVEEEEDKQKKSNLDDKLNKIKDRLNDELSDEYIEKEASFDLHKDTKSFEDMVDFEPVLDAKSTGEEAASNVDVETMDVDEASMDNQLQINVEYILEPDPSMMLIPTPIKSNESICSDQRSLRNITESDNEPSVGQNLTKTTSLKDVKVGIKRVRREGTPPLYVTGDIFWVHLPGIGAAVPQHVIDEVEVYARQCAAKQCGMVMPRNLRHFLCPTLDNLGEDVFLLKEPECVICCFDAIDKEEAHKIVRLPESSLKDFIL